MKNIVAIYKRELAASFQTPGVYVVAGLFFFLVSSIVTQGVFQYARESTAASPAEKLDFTQTVVAGAFGGVSILFIFIVPIIAMRVLAEEKRSGAFELLATWPIRDWELILGKFLSLASVLLIMDLFMLSYVGAFYLLASPDTGVVICCYLGLVLISLAYASFGLFASSLTENQFIAATVTFVGLFFFWIVQNLGEGTSLLADVCEALSVYLHFENFAKGAVALGDVAYFVLFTVFWLFLTARVLESRRWRQ